MLQTRIASGGDLISIRSALADLRIRVFRDYPYLYEGDLAYEERYLETYVNSARSICVLVMDGDAVVGASTGIPLSDETADVKAPFIEAGWDLSTVFYCGESVLLPEYRGKGVYKAFFTGREAHAKNLGFEWSAFCGVVRPEAHPLKPKDYLPLDDIWRRFGYAPRPELVAQFTWKDIGEPAATPKPMRFWLKKLVVSS